VKYRYRPDILVDLHERGIFPRPHSSPRVVKDYLSALYRYELRVLRDRLHAREFPKAAYAARVEALRRRYLLLALPWRDWAAVD
jgi:hypothetical protein